MHCCLWLFDVCIFATLSSNTVYGVAALLKRDRHVSMVNGHRRMQQFYFLLFCHRKAIRGHNDVYE
jgi:hypothetical protein